MSIKRFDTRIAPDSFSTSYHLAYGAGLAGARPAIGR